MIRQSSIDAYRKVLESGLLPQRQREIYEVLCEFGPLTANEVFKRIIGRSQINQANIATRLNEMRERGCVRELERAYCSVTGNKVIVWAPTGDLPQPISKEKKASRKELEARIKQLESALNSCSCGKQMGLFPQEMFIDKGAAIWNQVAQRIKP